MCISTCNCATTHGNVYDAGDVCLGAFAPGWAGCRSRLPSLNEGFSQARPVPCSVFALKHRAPCGRAARNRHLWQLAELLEFERLSRVGASLIGPFPVVSQTEAFGNGAGGIPEDPGGFAVKPFHRQPSAM